MDNENLTSFLKTNYLYYFVEATRWQMSPARLGILNSLHWFENTYNPIYYTNFARTMRASLEIAERITRKYQKPHFGITQCVVGNKTCAVEKKTEITKSFCKL